MYMNRRRVQYNRVFTNIIYLVIASSGLFLLTNRYPLLAVSSFLALFFLGIIFLFYKGTITSYHSEIIGLLAIIYLYLILSYFISGQTLQNFISYPFLRYDGNFFFAYMPFFALAIPYFDYRKASRIYTGLLFFIFSIFSLIGIYGYITNNLVFSMFQYESDRGIIFTAMNRAHNATGSVYAMVCIILLSFFLKEKKKIKILYLFIFIISLVGLLITKSRGSYIGFIVGAVLVLWLFFRSWRKFAITIGAFSVLAIPALYFSGIYRRIPDFFDLASGTSEIRLRLWEKAWYLFSQSPVFGVGFARYNDIGYEDIRLLGIPQIISIFIEPKFDHSAAHAHSSYLQFLSETGIIGLGLLMLFWILFYLKMLKAYNSARDNFSEKIFLSSLGVIGTLFALSITENYFSSTTVMMCVSVFLSLALGLFWQENNLKEIK